MALRELKIGALSGGSWPVELDGSGPIGAIHEAGLAAVAASAWAALRASNPNPAALKAAADGLAAALPAAILGLGPALLSADAAFPVLPWEILSLASGMGSPPSFAHLAPTPAPLPALGWPVKVLQVLAIKARNPAEQGKVADLIARERAHLAAALRGVRKNGLWSSRGNDFDLIWGADPKVDVIDLINDQRPDVLHLVCHGDYVEATGETTLQTFDTLLTPLLIRGKLKHTPRLVVLNACHAGVPLATSSVVGALLGLGVGAVVSMQREIWARTSALFTGAFYGALAEGADLATAFSAATGACVAGDAAEHLAPRLRVRSADALSPILPDLEVRRLARQRLDANKEHRPLRAFVDRDEKRREIWTCGDPVIGVLGPPASGKTWFARMAAERFALSGEIVCFVPDPGKGEEWLWLVNRLSSRGTGLEAELPGAPELFAEFRAQLKALGNPTSLSSLPNAAVPGTNTQEELLKAFLRALDRVPDHLQGRTCRLIIDGAGLLTQDCWSELFSRLARIAQAPGSWLRLVFVLSETAQERFNELGAARAIVLPPDLPFEGGWTLTQAARQIFKSFPAMLPDEGADLWQKNVIGWFQNTNDTTSLPLSFLKMILQQLTAKSTDFELPT